MMTDGTRPAILMVTVEVEEEDVDELNRWYDEEHGPEKLALPGYIGLRRFRASDGSPKFLTIYELEDPEAANGGERSDEAIERMKVIMATWKYWERSVWVTLEPPAS